MANETHRDALAELNLTIAAQHEIIQERERRIAELEVALKAGVEALEAVAPEDGITRDTRYGGDVCVWCGHELGCSAECPLVRAREALVKMKEVLS